MTQTASKKKAAEKESAPETAEKVERKIKSPPRSARNGVGYNWNLHDVEAGITDIPEDLLEPKYWSAMAQDIKVGDDVRVKRCDGAWLCWVHVVSKGHHTLNVVPYPGMSLELDVKHTEDITIDGYTVGFRHGSNKWVVIDEAGHMIAKGMDTLQQAVLEVANIKQARAA